MKKPTNTAKPAKPSKHDAELKRLRAFKAEADRREATRHQLAGRADFLARTAALNAITLKFRGQENPPTAETEMAAFEARKALFYSSMADALRYSGAHAEDDNGIGLLRIRNWKEVRR